MSKRKPTERFRASVLNTKAPLKTPFVDINPPAPLCNQGGLQDGAFDEGLAGPTRLELATSGVTENRFLAKSTSLNPEKS